MSRKNFPLANYHRGILPAQALCDMLSLTRFRKCKCFFVLDHFIPVGYNPEHLPVRTSDICFIARDQDTPLSINILFYHLPVQPCSP